MISGVTGSFMVISVNGWMNNPTGFDIVNNEVTNVRPLEALFNDYFWHEFFHMYVAGFIVAAFLVAGVYAFAWLKGRRDHYHRAALIVPLTFACIAAPVQLLVGDWAGRTVAEDQPVKLAAFEGLDQTERGRRFHHRRHLLRRRDPRRDHDPRPALAARRPRPERDRPGPRRVPGRRPAAGRRGPQRVPGHGLDRHGLALLGARLPRHLVAASARLPRSKWFYRAVVAAGPAALVALIAGWIDDRGRPPAVDRLRRRCGRPRRSPAPRGSRSATRPWRSSTSALAVVVFWLLRRLAAPAARASSSPARRRSHR